MSEAPAPAAPAQAPAPAPAPGGGAVSGGEVPINPNPVNAPTPVGSQAPDKPVGELERGHGRPETRRESIKRAFDAAQAQQAKKAPTTKAKGEDRSKDEVPADQKLNLKQRPEPHREQGRFARRPDAEPGTQPGGDRGQLAPGARPGQPGQPGAQAAPGKAPALVAPLPENAPFREAPARFSEKSRAEWAAAPESVRGAVHQMAQEFEGAYRKYRADNETMNTIRNFHEMATQHGTTLQRALTNYVSMEQKLRSDVVGGLDVIVNNLNLRTADGRKLGLRDVAYHILNQTPEQHRLTQHQNAAQAQTHQIGELHQMVGSLAQTVQQMQHVQQFGHTRNAVDSFADDGNHPRFDELGDLIEQELAFGFDLETAYRRAEMLRPGAPRTGGSDPRSTPAQTRSDKSIHGAPEAAPSNGAGTERRKGDKPIGRREAISNAIKRVNGRV